MQFTKLFYLFALLLVLNSCQQASYSGRGTEIVWDEWGVPHIYADNNEDLFHAFGYAQMNNHANLILDLMATSRGQAARYKGSAAVPSDRLVHSLDIPRTAQVWYEEQSPEMRGYLQAFVAGMNAFAEANPDSIAPRWRSVLPLSETDVLGHGIFVISTRFVGGQDLGLVANWEELGSNAYAVGPKRSASSNAMLVQNPHLPWGGEFTWIEAHLNGPSFNLYGATLVGLPVLGIGFNENLGWTHTNNTIDNADTYELTLQDGGYLLDGAVQQFKVRTKVIEVLQPDGSLREEDLRLLESEHGPVVRAGESKALALRLAGMEHEDVLEQWWKMGTATSFEEFESALKMMQLPFFNVMYADKVGNIFYLFNGSVPKRPVDEWRFWRGTVPGDSSALIWKDYHSYEELPKLKNPETGWLQNANDAPWSSTIPMALQAENYPGYMAPNGPMSMRPQRSAQMLYEDSSVTFEELQAYKLSTRLALADRVLDDLIAIVDTSDNQAAQAAGLVLRNWDRQTNTDSRGAMLFYNWARAMQLSNYERFAEPYDPQRPLSTPDGLADHQAALDLLLQAAQETQEQFGAMDVAWGDAFRVRRDTLDLPANGADGSMGVFRVTWPGGFTDSVYTAGGGDSWVSVIEFDNRVKAKVLLSYGNSSQPNSPHNGDQLELYSERRLRDAHFYRRDVARHGQYKMVLQDSLYVTKGR